VAPLRLDVSSPRAIELSEPSGTRRHQRGPLVPLEASSRSFRETTLAAPAHLFAGSLVVHVLEEAPGFTSWARAHASARYTQRDFIRNNALGLALTGAATWTLLLRPPGRASFFACYSTIVTQQALFNTAFHLSTAAAWRTYSPGLVSSIALFLPSWWRLTNRALEARLISKRGVLAGAAIGGAIHAAVVARQVFFLGVPDRGRAH
jgi:hypothetical protein